MVDWGVIDAKYPSKLDKDSMSVEEYRKLRTIELYDYLPQTSLEDRATYTDIRDAVIELNYTFFGYIASHTFINNSSISYEDKFQSALLHFCEMWHKFKFAAKYRTDLSFGVFFKPRVGECIERELNEVKYSLRRSLCMEVGEQLNKHWGQVTYDDLKHVKLSPEKMVALQAIFGSMYVADLETHAMFIESTDKNFGEVPGSSENYTNLTDMLVHEMVSEEKLLTESDLLNLATILDVSYIKLQELLPEAEKKLHTMLTQKKELAETFA